MSRSFNLADKAAPNTHRPRHDPHSTRRTRHPRTPSTIDGWICRPALSTCMIHTHPGQKPAQLPPIYVQPSHHLMSNRALRAGLAGRLRADGSVGLLERHGLILLALLYVPTTVSKTPATLPGEPVLTVHLATLISAGTTAGRPLPGFSPLRTARAAIAR